MTLEQRSLKAIQDELIKICFENNINPENIKIEFDSNIIKATLLKAIHKVEIKGCIKIDD